MVSAFRKFNGEWFKCQIIKPTKASALKEVKLYRTSAIYRLKKYRIVKVKLTTPNKDRAKEFKNLKFAYALYGR